MAPRNKTFALSIFLSKKKKNKDDCINKDKIKKYKAEKINLASPLDGVVYVYHSPSDVPDWVRYLSPHTAGSKKIVNLLQPGFSNSAVVVLYLSKLTRCVILAFGYGKSLLKYESLEIFFGRNVILNSTDLDKIISVKSRSYDQQPRHKESQGTTISNLNEFDLNLENEILQKLTAQYPEEFFEDEGLEKSSVGRKITGYDSISLSTSLALDKIDPLCAWLSDRFESDEYKKRLPDIDSFYQVKDEDLIKKLNGKLISFIRTKKVDQFHISVPFSLDTEEFIQVSLLGLGRKVCDLLKSDSLCMYDVCKNLEDSDLLDSVDIEQLKSKYQLICYSNKDSNRNKRPSLYRCITGEVKLGQETYALMDGDWFKIEKDFFERIVKYLNSRVSYDFVRLSPYLVTDKDEYDYNSRQNREHGHHLFDQNTIPLRGKGPIEVCDLLCHTGRLIHVKRYSASSTLSHLFSQGYVSIKSLMEDESFREKFLGKISSAGKRSRFKRSLDNRETVIVFAILIKKTRQRDPSKKIRNIPAFSIVNLHRFAREIETLGFKVKVQFVFH